MDNINKDNLAKFISYFIIVFLLSIVLYLMYIDFISETFLSKTEKFSDIGINKKLENINSVKNNTKIIEKLSNQIDPLIFDPNAAYILKKDLLAGNNQLAVTNALCSINDKTIVKNNTTKCLTNTNNLYLNTSGSNKFSIKVIPDGMNNPPDVNNFSYYSYDVNVTDINNEPLNILRLTYFYFPDDKISSILGTLPRQFDFSKKYDMAIMKYFNNYAKYNNNIDLNLYNQMITPPIEPNTPSNPNNDNMLLINSYNKYLQNLLLLSNTSNSTPFEYESGYQFDINNIKTRLISLYQLLLADTSIKIQFNMIINDTTNITFYYDDPNDMNVYAFELNPNILITFSNLNLTFSRLPKGIQPGSIWSLNFITALTPVNTPDVVYSYIDIINYPIVLPLATPKTDNWENNTTNGVLYYFKSIFKRSGLQNLQFIDITNNNEPILNTTGEQIVINNLTNFVKLIGNTNLLSITDIFLLYDPLSNVGQIWVITNMIDDTTQEAIVAPLLYFYGIYNPTNCTSGMYYNNKCLPACPDGFKYDLGLVCLNSNSSNYLPETDICKYINGLNLSSNTPINPTIAGMKEGCDKEYFDKNKIIRQTDVTGPLYTLPQDTTIKNDDDDYNE